MTRSRIWSPRLAALAATVAIIFTACSGGAPSVAPSAEPPATAAPATAAPATAAPAPDAPYVGADYPESGEAPCGTDPYSGNFKRISAPDANTVVFELCNPDVAFLSKIAFISFAINDTAWLESKVDPAKADNQAIVSEVNGTGPWKLEAWNRGSDITLVRNDNYWGPDARTEKLIIRWGAEAAQRLVELQAGSVDAIDNVGPTDFATVIDNPELQLKPREGLNVMYIGMNNTYAPFTDVRVRQAIAMAIDRSRIVNTFYPSGSEVASHFTPCSIPNGCAGDAWYDFDVAAAKDLLTAAGFPDGFSTKLYYRNVVRGYLPDPVVVGTDIQAQLKNNLNIDVEIVEQESGTFLDNADAGALDGLHLLGWGADYPDVTNFLDFHFGAGSSKQFGDKFTDITGALAEGGAGLTDALREPSYVAANNAIRANVPMIPVVHGGSAVAYRADVSNAHASPLGNEEFAPMIPGDRTQFVWMQNAEPPGLYCADESDGEALRVCEQIMESLYAYETAGTAAIPSLAEKCEPNPELTVWTCALRQNVTFHDGSTLDANDVVLSYAVQWDAAHPLHKGRDNSFTYFPGLFSGFLNPPAG